MNPFDREEENCIRYFMNEYNFILVEKLCFAQIFFWLPCVKDPVDKTEHFLCSFVFEITRNFQQSGRIWYIYVWF